MAIPLVSDKFRLRQKYSDHLSKEILENYQKFLIRFKNEKNYNVYGDVERLTYYGLGNLLRKYVDKYLSLSQRTDYSYIRNGYTAACYRIGDYAFKLNHIKWSYEEEICPNLYIILKNLEEHFIRDEEGIVLAGLEIQKFLTKPLAVPEGLLEEILSFLKSELKRLGYYTTDTLMHGNCGDNCMFLDSYKDADSYNLELLPSFFKKYPAVIIDRDRIYKLENEFPKQISSCRYF